MKDRIKIAVVAVVLWAIFAACNAVITAAQLILIAYWLVTGSQSALEWLKRTGKAADQLTNAGIFNGHPKETVSSHIGKTYLLHRVNPERYPAPSLSFRFWRAVTDLFERHHVFRAIELQTGIEFTQTMKMKAIELAEEGKL
jgi:hypothetical protein